MTDVNAHHKQIYYGCIFEIDSFKEDLLHHYLTDLAPIFHIEA